MITVSKYAPIDAIVAFVFGGLFFIVGSLMLWLGIQASHMLISVVWLAVSLIVSFVSLQIMWIAAEKYEEIDVEKNSEGDRD